MLHAVMLLAHGVGVRGDLPLPVSMVAWGAAAVLVLSFVALAVLWREPRLEASRPGRLLPAGLDRGLNLLEWPLRIVGLVLALVVAVAATAGPDQLQQNLAPFAIYVALWVGVMFVSGFVGDVWYVLSPFVTVAKIGGITTNRTTETGETAETAETAEDPPLGARFGLWPAAVLLLGFVWLELVHPNPSDPRVLARAIGGYVAILLLGALWWGWSWVRNAEAFGAFFRILAAMAPFHRDEHGRLRARLPLVGLADYEAEPGAAAVIIVALGSTTFDGVTRLAWWEDLVAARPGWEAVPVATLGLLATIAVVGGLFVWAMADASRYTDRRTVELVRDFVHSLVPIALAYAVAHYFSLLVFEGQRVLALASDPLGLGWNLFGTAPWTVDYGAVSPTVIAWVQAGAIVAGHLAGVLLAHDRAVARFEGRAATRSQFALLVAMVAYTVGGLLLLLGG